LWETSGSGTFDNENALNPTYYPDAADVQAGSITLSITGYALGSCDDATDEITLSLIALPTADAGPDVSMCDTEETFALTGTATNYASVLWTTSGSGTFADQNSLTATYYPSDEDFNDGQVELMLTVNGNAPCGDANDFMVLSIWEAPSASAGINATICEGESHTLSGATANNYTSLLWETSGSGTFDNANALNPTYYPDAADVQAGSVTLSLTGYALGSCDDATDEITLSLIALPTADAGPDVSMCDTEETFALTGTATNYASVLWTTSGSGSFDDPTEPLTNYNPSDEDIADGQVELMLAVYGNGSCGDATDFMVLSIWAAPSANAGINATICEPETFTLSGATATNYSSLLWETDGSGTFSNANALNPTYYPSTADIDDGEIELTLTANPIGSCTEAQSGITLTIIPAAVADAGADASICETEESYTLDGVVENSTVYIWSTGGSGTFENMFDLNTNYYPSDADKQAGQINIWLIAYGDVNCGNDNDMMVLSFSPQATVTAGPDATLCEGEVWDMCCTSADNYTSLLWETSGTGTFDDATALNPQYTPSEADILAGNLTLTINAYAEDPCDDVSDTRTLTIIPEVIADAGNDQNIAATSTSLEGNDPTPGTGHWTQVNGPTIATIADPSNPETEISGLVSGTYVFRWTITNLPCFETWDEVSITLGVIADVAVDKSATPSTVIAGENVTYTIQVTNNGPDLAENVVMTDILLAQLTLVSATPTTGSWSDPAWSIGPMIAGAVETITIVATVDETYTGNISNTATVTSDTPDSDPTNNSDDAEITVPVHCDLGIVKTSPDDAVAGEMLTYGILVTNYGPSDAVNVTVTDVLPDVIENGEYSTDGGTNWNSWVSPMNIGGLASGDNYEFQIRGTVATGATGTIVNTAVVDSDTPDLNPDNNSSTVEDEVDVNIDICIIKTGPATAVPGETIQYSMYICPGVSDALDVVVEDIIPDELSNAEYSLDGGTTWVVWTGSLDVGTVYGGVPFEFLIRADVNPDVTGEIYNVATVTTSSPDSNPDNNTDDETTVVGPDADLSIEKTATALVVAGGQVEYTITVTNLGPSNAENVTIWDPMPDGVGDITYLPQDSTNWHAWSNPYDRGNLGVGESFTIQMRGEVDEDYTHNGQIINTATVTSSTQDSNPDNNEDDATTVVIQPPVANDNSSLNNLPGDDAVLMILENDQLGDGSEPVPADVVVDLDPDEPDVQHELIVPGEGTWTYFPAVGELVFSPEDGFLDDPTPITYTITEISTGLTSNIANVIVTYVCFTVDVQAFLEGPFDETTGLMNNTINNAGILPGEDPLPPVTPTPAGQPYDVTPWNYNDLSCDWYGDPSVNPEATTPYPDDVVDWVLVSIRQGDSLKSSEIFRCVGLIYRDGQIELECPCFKTTGVDKFYILVEHRNHFPVMSEVVHLDGGTELSYDFRYNDSWKLGTPIPQEVGQKQLGSYWVMLGGNGDQQLNPSSPFDINSIDFEKWTDDNGKLFRYMIGDFDMNLDANSLDDEIWINNNGKINFIPR
jgi:uncharacterized repeat protein (TIGR01451 family)